MTGNRDSLAAVPIAERVAAGIDLLDRKRPGWDEDIDVDFLYLDSCFHCVLGQLFGEFNVGKKALDILYPDTARCGFDRFDEDVSGTYDELAEEWVAAIQARREAVAR